MGTRSKCAAWLAGALAFIVGNLVIMFFSPIIYGGPFGLTILYLFIAYILISVLAFLLTWIMGGFEDEGGGRH